MRIAKRALAGLLILTVLVCALYVVSFADPVPSVPKVDCADLLIYFNPLTSKSYVNDDFEDGSFDGRLSVTAEDTDATRIEVIEGEGGSYLSLISGPIFNRFAAGELAYVADTSDVPEGRYALYVEYSVNAAYTARAIGECSALCGYYAEDINVANIPDICPLCSSAMTKDVSEAPAVSLYVGSDATALGQRLITLDFAADTVTYYGGSTDVTVAYELSENTDIWYDVEVALLENDEYKFTITSSASADTVFDEAVAAPTIGAAASVAFGYAYTHSNRDTVINLDDILVQCGEERCVMSVAELEDKLDAAIKDFIVILELGTDIKTKLEVIEAYSTIVDTYGFISEDAELISNMQVMDDKMLDVLFGYVLEVVSSINQNADYRDRLDHVGSSGNMVDKLEQLVAELEVSGSEYTDAIAAYRTECAALEADAENTERFIEYMQQLEEDGSDVFYTNDYAVLKSFCEAVEASYPYNPTYPGVDRARNNHLAVSDKYSLYCSQSAAFVAAANTAASTDPTLALSDRLAAYDFATENVFPYNSFPGVVDAIALLETLSDFASIKAAAKDFISKVNVAEHFLYINAKEAALAEAEAAMELASDDYVGVAEAKERCVALRAEIESQIAAAEDYIAAVAAIDGLTGQALADAIANAIEKQKSGNILGVPGVTEANIALDNAYMALERARVYSETYIALVANVDKATDLSARFAAIKAALAAEADAVDTVSGVTAAKAKLAQAISAYNADINSANSTYATVVDHAGDLCGAATSVSDIVALVIALIKSII